MCTPLQFSAEARPPSAEPQMLSKSPTLGLGSPFGGMMPPAEKIASMRVSVVVSTYNRCRWLQRLLEGLKWQTYREFEVVVVQGPSTDGTNELLSGYSQALKRVDCHRANISVSRNLGLSQAAGEVVAFIDDDAVPDPYWLEHLVNGFQERPHVDGLGGWVFDASGISTQYRQLGYDRRGELISYPVYRNFRAQFPCYPNCAVVPTLVGVNCAYRRSALFEVGGFDESIAYNYDDIDICCRLVDAGYRLDYQPEALVFHQVAASHLRDEQNRIYDSFPLVSNQTYVSLKNRDGVALTTLLNFFNEWVECQCRASWAQCREGSGSVGQSLRTTSRLLGAYASGLFRALLLPNPESKHLQSQCTDFAPFSTAAAPGPRVLLLSGPEQDHPYAWRLARELVAEGLDTHLMAGSEFAFDAGLWLHPANPEGQLPSPLRAPAVRLVDAQAGWSLEGLPLSDRTTLKQVLSRLK